ncbi:MAG: hypothetical protein H6659_00255 [Ardenticatenaceae bacterium]|nr:hypothetical protein [Ardenticatenaceae bacterium]MCB8987028.1 hypothetical protein [Ardenticatenaceae bacterium]
MKKHSLFLVLIALLLLMGCQSTEKPTPTPFPTVPAAGTFPVLPVGAQGIQISLADVLENPEFFEGTTVQVTGQFGRLPRLVCGLDPHPGPTTWTLQDGEALIQAGGFDEPLHELFPPGLTMTVAGRVEHWQGPIGCGKQAVPRDFWYLDVTRLISPSQIARVTLTPPVPGGEVIGEETPLVVPTDTGVPEAGSPQPTAVSVFPTSTSPVTIEPKPTLNLPTANPNLGTAVTGTLTLTPTGTITPGSNISTVTPSGVTGTPGATLTPSLTPRPGTTSTPTATTPPNSTATVTPPPTVTERGEIGYYDAFPDKLAANESHNWTIFLEVGQPITVSVIAEPDVNLGIRLFTPIGSVLAEKNQAPAGQVESAFLDVTTEGEYVIQVYSVGGRATPYYIALWDEAGDYRPMGTLQSGVTQSATINDVTTQVWFFKATAGQNFSVQTSSSSGSDLLLLLIDPQDQLLTYQSTQIGDFPLEEDGWYSLEVEEFLLEQNTYQLTMTLQ